VRTIDENEVYLELGLAGSLGSLDSLNQAKTGILDLLGLGLLVLLQLLVSLLELLHLSLESGLRLLEDLLLLGDESVKRGDGHGLQACDLLLLLIVAKIDVGRRAARLQALRELLEGLLVTATLVVLEVSGVAVLDGGVSLNTDLIAERLTSSRAVNVSNEDGLVVLVLSHERVPSRLHGLAVPSPRRKELDKDGLARDGIIVVGGGELKGAGPHKEGGREKDTHHVHFALLG
jgi:hypothetical protein